MAQWCIPAMRGERLGAYAALPEYAALAAADAGRVRFFYALCDEYFHTEHLNLAEGLLQRRIAERMADVENAAAAPGRMPDDVPDIWENDFSGLEADGREALMRLLGDAPMTLG